MSDESHRILRMILICITFLFMLGNAFWIRESVNLRKELNNLQMRWMEDVRKIEEEKKIILDTAFYIRNTSEYYIKDNERFEKFMLNGTRIILEEMEDYKEKTPSNGRMSKEEIKRYLEITYVGCNLVGIDPYLSLFQSVLESSGFNKRSISNMGAIGVEQFMPITAKLVANSPSPWSELQTSLYSINLLYDPVESKKLNIRYMKYLLEEFDGRIEWALIAYNAGPRRAKEYWRNGEAVFHEDVPEKYRKYADYILKQYKRISGEER